MVLVQSAAEQHVYVGLWLRSPVYTSCLSGFPSLVVYRSHPVSSVSLTIPDHAAM
jgi:hypothetical protein